MKSTFSALRSVLTVAQFKRLLNWVQQELTAVDSCDFWRKPTSLDNESLIDTLLEFFYLKDPVVLESHEPCRAAIDKVVEMYRIEFSGC